MLLGGFQVRARVTATGWSCTVANWEFLCFVQDCDVVVARIHQGRAGWRFPRRVMWGPATNWEWCFFTVSGTIASLTSLHWRTLAKRPVSWRTISSHFNSRVFSVSCKSSDGVKTRTPLEERFGGAHHPAQCVRPILGSHGGTNRWARFDTWAKVPRPLPRCKWTKVAVEMTVQKKSVGKIQSGFFFQENWSEDFVKKKCKWSERSVVWKDYKEPDVCQNGTEKNKLNLRSPVQRKRISNFRSWDGTQSVELQNRNKEIGI